MLWPKPGFFQAHISSIIVVTSKTKIK